jgi:hypothetical protein
MDPSVHRVEMIYSLSKNFKVGFDIIRSHATDVRIFENPFSVEVSDASEKLQFELSELQCELAFQKWNQMLIFSRKKAGPSFTLIG